MFTGAWKTYIKKIIVKIAFSAKPNRFYEIYTQNTSDNQRLVRLKVHVI